MIATIGELFTDAEIRKARKLWRGYSGGHFDGFVERAENEIVRAALVRINAQTGQENDARYLAYVLEYAMTAGDQIVAAWEE